MRVRRKGNDNKDFSPLSDLQHLGASLRWLPSISEHLPTFQNLSHVVNFTQKLKPETSETTLHPGTKSGRPSTWAGAFGEAFSSSVGEADCWHDRCRGAVRSETSPGCGCVTAESSSLAPSQRPRVLISTDTLSSG